MKRFLLLTTIMCILGGVKFTNLNAQEQTITIGTGKSATEYVPYCERNLSGAGYSVSQQLYSKTDLEGLPENVTIKSISFFLQYSDKNDRNISVYMKNTDKTSNTNTETYTDNDKVFSGVVTTNKNDDMLLTITFTNDFIYTGNGIFIYVNDVTGTKTSLYNKFYYTSKSGGAKYGYSSTGPLTTTDMNRSGNYINNIKITYVEGSSSSPTAPDAPTLTSPANNATDIFNPALNFTLGANTDEYQIMLGTGTSMNAITGWTEGRNNANVSYQTHGLEYGKTYYWKVVARKAAGTDYISTESETYSFSTRNVTAAPEAISGIFPANDAEVTSDPNLSWTFGENTEQYQVWFGFDREQLYLEQDWTYTNNNQTASFATSNIDLYKDQVYNENGLDANTTYNWKIVTKNGIGTTESDVFVFTKLGAPGNVTPIYPANGATGVSNTATLTWNFATNTTHYRVLMDLGNGALEYVTGNTWIATNGATTGSFDTAPLEEIVAGRTYSWCVDVKNNAGQRSYYEGGESTPTIFSYETSDAAPVQYISPADNEVLTSQTALLEWNYGSGNKVTQYQVLMNVDGQELTTVKAWTERPTEGTGLVPSGSFTTDTLKTNTKYNWQVNVRKGETGEIIAGEIWSFVTPLVVPDNLTATPVNIYPSQETAYSTGSTTISWNAVDGATGYNVYVNEELIENPNNSSTTASNTYEIKGLSYNMEEGHAIKVSAYYSGIGESAKTEACHVRVTGYANINGFVKNESGSNIENATITITGTDRFGAEQHYGFTTNEDGAYSGKILEGEYTITATKDEYDSASKSLTVNANETSKNDFTLKSNNIFTVDIRNATIDDIYIYLENADWDIAATYDGTYTIYYQKDGGEIMSESAWFSRANNMSTTLVMASDSHFKTTWASLSNGTYRIGVSNTSGIINWCTKSIVRNYFIFVTDGNWEDSSNWVNGDMPNINDDAFIKAAATISSDITIKNVTITSNGSLSIKGSLIADNVFNQGAIGNMIINDGGQLHQNNNELTGKFIMNIVNPEGEWSTENKTGWQFISSPFTDASISDFTEVENDEYDFYKFNGDNTNEEWINIKDSTNLNFEDTFKAGCGYLASYAETETFSSTGTFNASTEHEFNITYSDSENKWANFHLLGNPFTFNMDLSKLNASGIATGIAIVKNDGTYEYLTSGTINVGNGFFVKTVEPTAFLTYNEKRNVRTENNSNINIKAEGNAGRDNVIINFAGAEKAGFPKLKNFNEAIANIYIAADEKRYAIFNYDTDIQEVEVSFETKQLGNYTISIEANGQFEHVILHDKKTGIETNLLLEDYSFTASNNDNNNRFVLRFANRQQPTDDNFAYQSGDELIINAEGDVQIIDMTGRMIFSGNVENSNGKINISNLNNAAYIVRVISENEVKVQKVIIH